MLLTCADIIERGSDMFLYHYRLSRGAVPEVYKNDDRSFGGVCHYHRWVANSTLGAFHIHHHYHYHSLSLSLVIIIVITRDHYRYHS